MLPQPDRGAALPPSRCSLLPRRVQAAGPLRRAPPARPPAVALVLLRLIKRPLELALVTRRRDRTSALGDPIESRPRRLCRHKARAGSLSWRLCEPHPTAPRSSYLTCWIDFRGKENARWSTPARADAGTGREKECPELLRGVVLRLFELESVEAGRGTVAVEVDGRLCPLVEDESVTVERDDCRREHRPHEFAHDGAQRPQGSRFMDVPSGAADRLSCRLDALLVEDDPLVLFR